MEGMISFKFLKDLNLNFILNSQEPLEGWVDSLNGPIGIMIAGGKGVLRTMMCEVGYTAEVIPVDMAINGIISIAYIMGTMAER